MALNLSRGFWRLWLFFSFVWVVFCAWNIWDASCQIKKAKELGRYYTKASSDAKKLESNVIMTPIVSAHLSEQIKFNSKVLEEQKTREGNYLRLIWLVPLITLVFAKGIPWVWEGFRA